MEENKPATKSSFWPFVARTAAVLVLVAVFLDLILPDFGKIKVSLYSDVARVKGKLMRNFETEQAKLYILSFVQNPAALYKASEVAERESRMDSAVRDMELAIGLLEMHSADKLVIKRYYGRLEKLQTEAKASK